MKRDNNNVTELASSRMTVDGRDKCRTDATSWSDGVVKTAIKKSVRSGNKQKREKTSDLFCEPT